VIRFRHKGCQSEAFSHLGDASTGTPDQTHSAALKTKDRHGRYPKCPDCGFFLWLLEESGWEVIPEPVEA
tara:strand:+ start:207 stop:416 length:210 start_codon:yes stop_codon:yes gene_type:complete